MKYSALPYPESLVFAGPVSSRYLPKGASVFCGLCGYLVLYTFARSRTSETLEALDTNACGVNNNPLGPALHAKSRVHPRNFHNLHLNICLKHHGMGKGGNATLFLCLARTKKLKIFLIIYDICANRSISFHVFNKKRFIRMHRCPTKKKVQPWHLYNCTCPSCLYNYLKVQCVTCERDLLAWKWNKKCACMFLVS